MQPQTQKFFIYARKSSEEEDRQTLSIDAQLSELRTISQNEGITVVGTFTECKSAKAPGRPVFNDMLSKIAKGEAHGILSWKLDRLARNFEDGGKIIELLQRETIKKIRTFDRTYLPGDNVLMIALELGMANQYVRDLTVNIKRGIREKIRRGIYHGRAPLGYFNHPKLRTVEPDPIQFPKVKRALERFSTGRYTLTATSHSMAADGILGILSGKPLPISSIGNLLRNPFYYGVFRHKGELIEGSHVPMITKKTFDEIQNALVAVGKPPKHRGQKGFLFLNFATCASCGYSITAERHVKPSGRRFLYYRCTHKCTKRPCTQSRYIREERFAEEVKRNARLVALPTEWKDKFLAKAENWESERSHAKQKKIDELKRHLADVKVKMARVNDAFAEGSIDTNEFKDLKNPMVQKKAELTQQITALELSKGDRLEPLKRWILAANDAENWLSSDNFQELKSFLTRVGSNRRLAGETLTVSFKPPWDFLAKTTLALRSAKSVSEQSSTWWTLLEQYRTFFDENPE